MTDISQTWATIPDCPNYECLYDRPHSIVKIRKKRQAMGYRMGIQSRGKTGGITLKPGPDGKVSLKNHPNLGAERWTPEELWLHTFKGKRLIKPKERLEIKNREAAKRRASMQKEKVSE